MAAPLPPEIHGLIAAYVPEKLDLCALALSSRSLRPIAESELYWSIHLCRRLGIWRLCKSIVTFHHVGHLIRESEFNDFPDFPDLPDDLFPDDLLLNDYRFLAASALAHTPNLSILRLFFRARHGSLIPELLPSPPPFSLTKFESNCRVDDAFMAFLSTQDTLHTLKSVAYLTYLNTTSQALQLLSADALPALQMLELDDTRLVDVFRQALTSVQTLRCIFTPTIPLLGIVEHLDALRGMAPNLAMLGYLGGPSVMEIAVLQALARFTSLRSIVINTEMPDETIMDIFNQIPSLRAVVTVSWKYESPSTYRVMQISRPGYFETTVNEGGSPAEFLARYGEAV